MRLVALFLILCLTTSVLSQTVEEVHPKTLWCPNDTFVLGFKDYPKRFPYRVSREDDASPGTDAKLDDYAILYYGNDSLRLYYHNRLPYGHNFYVNFESPKGKTTFRFHFNSVANFFPAAYIEKNTGNIQFDIPEAYELANIIWSLSPSGERASNLNKEGGYYKEVMAHFKPYRDHPIFRSLDFPDSVYHLKYYDFRENSFAFNFEDPKPGSAHTELRFSGPYYYVFGNELADSSLFGKLKPLVEDFARKSKFRQFYKNHLTYYQNALARQRQLLPVRQMWRWLEEQFPNSKYQSYRVVFSPLINSSHSTQRYSTYYRNNVFSENVMFICGPERYDTMNDLTEKQKEGLMSGIVFTEIDHNYVNPETDQCTKQVDSIFANQGIWSQKSQSNAFYQSPVSIFNEYMTHAVFCLWVLDTYDKPTADFVIDKREELMVAKRNFIRFREFNRELIRLRAEHKDKKVTGLYPYILEWCSKQ